MKNKEIEKFENSVKELLGGLDKIDIEIEEDELDIEKSFLDLEKTEDKELD